MTIVLYNMTAENNRVDKTGYLTTVDTLTGTLREQTSIINPSIMIERATLPTFNYIYISDFNRYYFVTGIESVRNNLWHINAHVDVLMTYKTAITSVDALVSRNEYNYDVNLVDNRVICRKNPTVTVTEIANSVFKLGDADAEIPYVFTRVSNV